MNAGVRRVLVALLSVAAATACVLLGLWQLRRASGKQALRAEQAAVLARPPVDLAAGTTAVVAGQRVTLRGRWDRDRHILLSGRTHLGAAGVHVVTPLMLPSGERVLVERGWLAAADSRTAHPESWPDSTAALTGVSVALPAAAHRVPWAPLEPSRAGVELWSARTLDSAEVAARVPAPVARFAVLAAADTSDAAAAREGLLAIPYEPPGPGARMHYVYAAQWFAIALGIVAGSLALARRRRPPAAPR